MVLQIQSVIYGNEKSSLLKAIKAIKQAAAVYHKRRHAMEVRLVYGDASPNSVFSESDVQEIQDYLTDTVHFDYRVFGFNSGTAKGHNLMGMESESDYMMIMNPDVILEPQCIVKLMDALQDNEVGMAEARQTPLEHAKEYDKKTGETEWASTACTIFKTSIFKEIGGFDADTFFLYCDDLDFSWRLRLAGYKIQYVPSAIAYHAKTLSIDGTWTPTGAEIYYSAEAAILLAYKWSNTQRAEYLSKQFQNHGGASEKKAAEEYERRKSQNHLPRQLDPEHHVARFLKDDYCEMRFYFQGE